MIGHLLRSIAQFRDPAFWKVLWKALAITVVMAILVAWVSWELIGALVQIKASWLSEGASGWLTTAVDWLARAGVVILMILLFPAATSLFIGLFLDDIADAVERRHYPGEPTGDGLSLRGAVWVSAKFAAVVLLFNILVLPLYLVLFWLPPASLVIFYGLNGYLLGREYFELVALRHLPEKEAARLRRANRARIFLTGVIIALFLSVPLVNLLVPVAATALMVHVYKSMSGVRAA